MMEDPYLAEILSTQKKEPLYTEIKGSYFFAKAKDTLGNWHYLAADSEEAIQKYCEEYSPSVLSHKELAIDQWINYVDPIQVWYHFKWVGKRQNPFVMAKPFKYKGPKKWTWEDNRYKSTKVRLGGPPMKTALVEEAREIARKELDKRKT
jgi:hypothetical protein